MVPPAVAPDPILPMPPEPGHPSWLRLLATVVAVMGALTLVLSGLCTVVFLVAFNTQVPTSQRDLVYNVGLPLYFGGPVMAAGLVLWLLGRWGRRRWTKPAPPAHNAPEAARRGP